MICGSYVGMSFPVSLRIDFISGTLPLLLKQPTPKIEHSGRTLTTPRHALLPSASLIQAPGVVLPCLLRVLVPALSSVTCTMTCCTGREVEQETDQLLASNACCWCCRLTSSQQYVYQPNATAVDTNVVKHDVRHLEKQSACSYCCLLLTHVYAVLR